MNLDEIMNIVNRLNEAEQAEKNLEDNTEEMAKPIRAFVLKAIREYFSTKEALKVIADGGGFRGSISTRHCKENEREMSVYGSGTSYSIWIIQKNVGGKWVAVDCGLHWSLSQSPRFEFDLFYRYEWMRHDMEYAVNYINTHKWNAQGYITLEGEAARLNERTETMKRVALSHAEKRIAEVKRLAGDMMA